MGRSPRPCCDEFGLKKGPWTPEEDDLLVDYIERRGHRSWRALPKLAGLKRWSQIATHLPGRTDNEIKNYWNTHLKKNLLEMGIDPITHRPRIDLNLLANLPHPLSAANLSNLMNPWDNVLRLQADAAQLAMIQLLHNLAQVMSTRTAPPNMDMLNQLGSAPVQDYLLNECLRSNSTQFDGLTNNGHPPFGLNVINPNQQTLSSFSNLVAQQPNYEYQAIPNTFDHHLEGEPNSANLSNIDSYHLSSSHSIASANTIPALVSALDNELNDCYWNDLIDQTTSPSGPISQ